MSKRNIAYIKPQDPSFLAKLKAQIGYQEGPTVDTKKQRLDQEEDDCNSDADSIGERDDEKPQIVVLKTGDLTAEEVVQEEQRLAKEAAEKPADLNQRIIFKKRKPAGKDDSNSKEAATHSAPATATASSKGRLKSGNKKSKQTVTSSKLSFNNDDPEEGSDD